MSVQIFLSSDLADVKINGTQNSSLLYYLKDPIVPQDGYQMSVKLVNAAIPCSFYLITSTNNKLVLNGTTYFLTQGNYTAYTLLDLLNATLSAVLTVSFDTGTNKFVFSAVLTNFSINSTSTCQKLLGFPTGSDLTSSAYTLKSTYPVDLSGDNMLYLAVQNLQLQNRLGGGKSSILKALPVSVSQGGVLFYDDNSGTPGFNIFEDHIGFLHVKLYGEDAVTLLDLQNARWSVTIEVSFTRKEILTYRNPKSFRDVYDQYRQGLQGSDN